MELHRRLILLRGGCGLLDPFDDFPSATNDVRSSQGGATMAACRRHGLEVQDEGHLTGFIVVFVFVEVLCNARCFRFLKSPHPCTFYVFYLSKK
jgi:hypothetical protein